MTDMEALRAHVYGAPTIARAAPLGHTRAKWPIKSPMVPLTPEERAEVKARMAREAREQAAWERAEARAAKRKR